MPWGGAPCPSGAPRSGGAELAFTRCSPDGGRCYSCAVPGVQIYLTSWCPFCQRATQLLREKGQSFESIDIEAEPERRGEMIERSGRSSVPQVFIGARHVGGYDDLAALDAAGELDPLLAS